MESNEPHLRSSKVASEEHLRHMSRHMKDIVRDTVPTDEDIK